MQGLFQRLDLLGEQFGLVEVTPSLESIERRQIQYVGVVELLQQAVHRVETAGASCDQTQARA